jgi:hypothetical protein
MTRVLLDTNVYDKLALDTERRARIANLVAAQRLLVIATPIIVDELALSPLGGLPDWFPVVVEPENVTVLGFARLGMARLGEGDVYTKHRGASKNIKDGIVADSADALADILVSEDARCRRRMTEISSRCVGMSYEAFGRWLEDLAKAPAV